MMTQNLRLFPLTILFIFIVMVAGCSDNNITAPDSGESTFIQSEKYYAGVDGEMVQIFARVATTNQNSLMLTFYGCPDTAVAFQNCEIVRFNNSNEAPVPFSDIHSGDSLHVNGQRQQNGYIFAHRIQICCDTSCVYDVAFRDTISSIDYQAGSFTVAGHTQTIFVDTNTEIWTVVNHDGNKPDNDSNVVVPAGGAARVGPEAESDNQKILLAFTDLQVGDVVEVRADIIDAESFLAIKIKVADCNNYREYVDFEATIAAIDFELNLVTFEALNWIGHICKGTKLTGLDGEVLTLDAFAPGDFVYVKGFPETGDSLKICEMTKR